MRVPPRLEPYAIMVADMVGYSQRLAQNPIATHVAFQSHLHDVFQPAVRTHGGRIVKTTGDGFVAIFADADQGECCGRAIQVQLDEAEPVCFPSIRYRIAVHHGQIVIERHDVFGLDVNIAIHMQQLAPPDGICISGALFHLLPKQSRQRYRYVGQKYLKNIPDAVPIHTYDPSANSFDRPRLDERLPKARRSHLSPPPRLGVAEFQTVAKSASQQALAGIAHDCLTHGLSQFHDVLSVASIGAEVTRIEAERVGFREFLSNEMACEYLLRGSCIIGPKTLALTVHLESLVRRAIIWSGKVKVDLEDEMDLLDDLIAAEVAAPVVLYLERSEATSWGMNRLSEDEIRFRQAKRLLEQRTLPAIKQARHLLTEVVRRCGDVGDVHIALARAEHSHGLLLAGDQFDESIERAWGYAKKAVELDGLNPQAHAEMALQEMFLKRQGDAAEIYRHALRLNPYDLMLRADWADSLVNVGRAEEAASIFEKILSGWPRDRAWVEWGLCDAYWALDRPDRVVALLDRHPDQPHVHRNLAASYAKLGRLSDARRHADSVRRHQPGFSAKTWRQVMPNTNVDNSDEFVDHLERAGL